MLVGSVLYEAERLWDTPSCGWMHRCSQAGSRGTPPWPGPNPAWGYPLPRGQTGQVLDIMALGREASVLYFAGHIPTRKNTVPNPPRHGPQTQISNCWSSRPLKWPKLHSIRLITAVGRPRGGFRPVGKKFPTGHVGTGSLLSRHPVNRARS